jgi:hypothetical protein
MTNPSALMVGSLAAAPSEAESRPIDSSREVRPTPADCCFPCHGPDDRAREARLRLDDPATATGELAGRLKPGVTHGSTDEPGPHVAAGRVHIHDIQATILRLLGLDHTKLTYRFQGRDFRLTDVHGQVIKAILA